MKIFITGVAGFVGRKLAQYALDARCEVFGIEHSASKTNNLMLRHEKLNIFTGDITDRKGFIRQLEDVEPTRIFHLAGQTNVASSWKDPFETVHQNVSGQLNLLESVRKLKLKTKVLIVGSSDEYGMVEKTDLPINESQPLKPVSPYALSKVTQDLMGYQYFKNFGLHVVRMRAFNHTGPGQHGRFVMSSFAKQIAMIEKKMVEPVLKVGNLEAIRDFSDVRDIVRGYWMALERCKPGEVYNICSGKGYRVQDGLDLLLSFSREKIKVQVDPELLRPSDMPALVGDCSKFKNETGWAPEYTFKQTLEDLLNYWRKEIDSVELKPRDEARRA